MAADVEPSLFDVFAKNKLQKVRVIAYFSDIKQQIPEFPGFVASLF